MPDTEKADFFIESTRDSVVQKGEKRVSASLCKCLKGLIAIEWYLGLTDDDRHEMNCSTVSLVRLLARDLLKRTADIAVAVMKQTFG